MSKTQICFCKKCKIDFEMKLVKLRTDSGKPLFLYEGICPICRRQYEEVYD